ncbi:putative serine esterase [Mycolicibacterium litorale]|uniref:Serine esterase n=2 Tax=Mycolicibacterium litorale TaxID=758802 RepID=A0AAD1MSL5_9MYCO|nr:putative serine esterase [Mycolicibacterium litorale]
MVRSDADHVWHENQAVPPHKPGMYCQSRYLTMRDGIRIAVNLYLPTHRPAGARMPAIINQTRYYRAMELRQPARAAMRGKPFHHIPSTVACRRRFVGAGYAWVDVDVRGSGASFGHRVCEWSPDEIRDGAEVVDWIIRQPWSDGAVGALGSSYSGGAAELLLVNRHPAVRAVAPRFSPFDAYSDIAFPGGVRARWFTETWGRYNAALDRNAPWDAAGWWVRLFVTGVQPVDGDRDRSLRAQAIAAHDANYDIHRQAESLSFRDDVAPSDPYHRAGEEAPPLIGNPIDEAGSINLFSPHNYWRDVEASGAAVYSYSGWFDGAYAHSAIKRFHTVSTPVHRLILGPWSHGGGWHIEPFRAPAKSTFDHEGELLRFFDEHLGQRNSGLASEPRVRYFTMGEGRWKAASTWPPAATTRRFYLASGRMLTDAAPQDDRAADEYRVDVTAGTGEHSRWRTQVAIGEAVRYPERSGADRKLLTYTSAPLVSPLEVTGHPMVTLFVSSTADDANLFVYLEDVDTRGRIAYVTEGLLRAACRPISALPPPYRQDVPYRTFNRGDAKPLIAHEITELTFDLVPTSYLVRGGHRLRIAIAGADASHFAVADGTPPTLAVHRGRLHASHIDLPVVMPA